MTCRRTPCCHVRDEIALVAATEIVALLGKPMPGGACQLKAAVQVAVAEAIERSIGRACPNHLTLDACPARVTS